MLLRFVYLLLLLVLTPVPGVAQVNTEAMRVAGDRTGFQGLSVSQAMLMPGIPRSMKLQWRVGWTTSDPLTECSLSITMNTVTRMREAIKNEAFIALRNTWQWKPRLAVEAFVQQQQNEFIRLKDRKLIGGGVRITAVDVEKCAVRLAIPYVSGRCGHGRTGGHRCNYAT